jgi:4-hydroxybenzoate polyprenyltransferase
MARPARASDERETAPITASRVLCVDLDGTLVATDLLWESVFSVLRHRPWLLLIAPLWLLKGRAHLKRQLAEAAHIDFATLPYRAAVLEYIETERRHGRSVVLATASDQAIAAGVANHLGIFSSVLASDGQVNLKGRTKAATLISRFGAGNFDYIGDSRADIPCWECATTAMTTNPGWTGHVNGLRTIPVGQTGVGHTLRSIVRAARPYQWVKNLLLVVPVLAAHRFDWQVATDLLLAIASFSLCASGGYILNDLLDVTADRQHARKRRRPFAAGDLSLKSGVVLLAVTWTLGFGLAAAFLPGQFVAITGAYLAATASYSIRLKREPVLDVMFLAGLYVMRVIAGGMATNVPVSTWMLAFTLFVCLSLAFLKRFIEVNGHAGAIHAGAAHAGAASAMVPGRGYAAQDAAWLHSVGIASAYLSTVVLAIYANNPDVSRLYRHPQRLLLFCPILLYWATRVWLSAHRGQLHDDPVVAVSRDPVTYVVGALSAAIVWAAI